MNQMTGSPFNWNKTANSGEIEIPNTGGNDYVDYSYAKYLGGHPLYPRARDTGVYVYADRLEIVDPSLVIPFSAVSRIENMDENKVDWSSVAGKAVIFTPWAIHEAIRKRKHTYTVIRYTDEIDGVPYIRNLGQTKIQDIIRYTDGMEETTVVIDFDADIDRIQSLIYNKMVESKRKQ